MRAASWAIALAACGASPAPLPVVAVAPPPAPVVVVAVAVVDAAVDAGPMGVAAALAKLTELTEAMCRCGTSACANRLAESYRSWGQLLATSEDHASATGAEQAEWAELSRRLTVCMTDAVTSTATPEAR